MTPDEEVKSGVPQGGLAKDVAKLYSYAHIEEGNYRSFSRPSKLAGRPLAEVTQDSTAVATEAPESVEEEQRLTAAPAEPVAPQVEPASRVRTASPSRTPATIQGEAVRSPARPVWSEASSKPSSAQKTAIAICSIAGGTGKTTFVANIGRILSAQHESVLLVDTSGSTLLPFYFGAEDTRSGMRTFLSPEPGSQPMYVIGNESPTSEWLKDEVRPAMQTVQRTIFDLGPASFSLIPEIFPLCAVVVVPLLTDLNSIMSIPRIEGYHRMMDEQGVVAPWPVYVSNKFDIESERERSGRELIAREVGERLLPITIRRSPKVSEAIAQRMTVIDYAGESAIAQEFLQLALWLKKAAPVAQLARTTGRWSEA
ncbi:cellulose synthase operon protein YhjQ/BcsQ [Terracidiphilus gabretensis]|uniref:cellulose synthase operon protein YhjQ/BcsQ n=1 Tax=Terracidiphilus gabretensis TaxID=1577687 RepID=UPI00071B8EE4|nr:cellulose synthase operon protein YhjQ/BcsQ [Terracidiphilus gabretensis]